VTGTLAGTVAVRAAGLRIRGSGVVAAGDAVPSAGELAVFCRPVVTAPAVIRRDGTVRAEGGRVAVGDCVGQCVRLRKTCKSERAAQIEFGKLLEQAAAGRQPDPDVTVAPLLD